jgi:hypothetical protein
VLIELLGWTGLLKEQTNLGCPLSSNFSELFTGGNEKDNQLKKRRVGGKEKKIKKRKIKESQKRYSLYPRIRKTQAMTRQKAGHLTYTTHPPPIMHGPCLPTKVYITLYMELSDGSLSRRR